MARPKKVEVPVDQEIEVDDEKEQEIQEAAPEPVADIQEEPAPEPVPEPKEDESALKERLREQIRAELLAEQARKDADKDAQYQRQIQDGQRRAYEAETRAANSEYEALLNALGAAQAEADSAERDFATAATNQDIRAQAEAQRRLARAESRVDRIEEAKTRYDAQIEAQKNRPRQPQYPQQQNPVEAAIASLAEPAKNWFRKNPSYVTDPTKRAAVTHYHHEAENAGYVVLSPEYFEYVETKLGLRVKPDEVKSESRRERSTVVSAPVSREAPSTNGQRGPMRTTLSPEEREMAKSLKLSPTETDAQAEDRYAKNKIRLINAKKNGEIQ